MSSYSREWEPNPSAVAGVEGEAAGEEDVEFVIKVRMGFERPTRAQTLIAVCASPARILLTKGFEELPLPFMKNSGEGILVLLVD